MRGEDEASVALFSYVDMEARIPAKHPLLALGRLTNATLAELDGGVSRLYDRIGRPSMRRSACRCGAAAASLYDPLGAPAG